MTNPVCPKCGSKTRYRSKLFEGDKRPSGYICSLSPKDCRIKELEAQLEEAEFAARYFSDIGKPIPFTDANQDRATNAVKAALTRQKARKDSNKSHNEEEV